MRKHKRSGSLLATRIQKFNFDSKNYHIREDNKRGNSAKGCSLLPLALRPRLFGVVGIIAGLSIAIMNIVSPQDIYATNVTLTIPDAVSVSVNPTEGFAESTPGEVSVSTGNLGGYTLSIKSKNNSNDLVNESDSNAKLSSITEVLTLDQYKNGGNDKDYVNTWGLKPSNISNEANTSYVPGPTSSGIELAKTNNESSSGDKYSLAIATKVNESTIAGNYTNTFVLTAVPNEAKYNITYNLNGGSGGPGNITETGDIGSNATVTINGSTPSYSGKDFLGWCTENPGTGTSCSGALIQPGGKFPLCKCDLDLTLYAMWQTHVTPVDPNAMSSFNCGDLQPNATKGLTYGGKSYQVKKVGNMCWMWTDMPNTYTCDEAKKACSNIGGNWTLPTAQQFQTLINNIGAGKLWNEGWQHSEYWSSTPYVYGKGSYADTLEVSNGGASIREGVPTSYTNGARCVSQ